MCELVFVIIHSNKQSQHVFEFSHSQTVYCLQAAADNDIKKKYTAKQF